MNWIDVILFTIMAGAVLLEMKRGFGRTIFDFAALLVTMRLVSMLLPGLSHSIKLAADPHINEARLYVLSFILIGGLLLSLGKLIYDTTLVSADTFDALLGGIFGFGVGLMLCHALVKAIALTAGPNAIPDVIANSAFGTEFLTFQSYHDLMHTLYNLDRDETIVQ